MSFYPSGTFSFWRRMKLIQLSGGDPTWHASRIPRRRSFNFSSGIPTKKGSPFKASSITLLSPSSKPMEKKANAKAQKRRRDRCANRFFFHLYRLQ